jgi:hypothetical protein
MRPTDNVPSHQYLPDSKDPNTLYSLKLFTKTTMYEIESLLPTYVAATPLKIPFASAVCFSGPPTMTKKLSNRRTIVEFPPSKACVGCRVLVIQDKSVKSQHYTVYVATVAPMAIVSSSFSRCFVLFCSVSYIRLTCHDGLVGIMAHRVPLRSSSTAL